MRAGMVLPHLKAHLWPSPVWHASLESCMEVGVGVGQCALGRDWAGPRGLLVRQAQREGVQGALANQAADVPQLYATSLFRYRFGTTGFTLQYRSWYDLNHACIADCAHPMQAFDLFDADGSGSIGKRDI